MIEFVVPTVELKEKALGYRQEHFDFGETVINGSERFDQIKEYEVWLKAVEANALSHSQRRLGCDRYIFRSR